VLLHILPLSSV